MEWGSCCDTVGWKGDSGCRGAEVCLPRDQDFNRVRPGRQEERAGGELAAPDCEDGASV